MVATACSGTATPCDEVDIATGDNGLPDLGGCEFTFAVENAYLPFNYIDAETGEAAGWDYDVFNHMGELMNFTPVYVPTAWDGMIQATADGQFMIAGDGITITAERDEIVDFSNGYINLAQRVLVAADNSMVTSIDDLKAGIKILDDKTAYIQERFDCGVNNIVEAKITRMSYSGKSADLEVQVSGRRWNQDTEAYEDTVWSKDLEKVRVSNLKDAFLSGYNNLTWERA